MSSFLSPVQAIAQRFGTSDEVRCLNQANASPKVAQLDALVERLAKSWHPSGYFYVADIERLLVAFREEAAIAGAVLTAAPDSTRDAESAKRQAFEDAKRIYLDRSRPYERAVADAKARGAKVIDAPAFKMWVIGSLRTISDLYVTAAVLHCNWSAIESVLSKAYNGMAKVGEIAFGIGSAVVDAATDVIKAGEGLWALLKNIKKALPYIGIAAAGVGGVLLYRKLRGELESGSGERWGRDEMDHARRLP